MKTMKKLLPLLLCLIMVVAAFAVTASAAEEEPNVTISVDKTEVQVGDTITVKLGIKEMTGTSLAFGFDFDNTMLEATSVTGKSKAKIEFATYDPDTEDEPSGDYDYEDELAPTAISTKKNLNESGHFGVAYAYDYPYEALYYENDAVITIVFKALKAGTVEFEMFEDTAGTDGYKATWTEEKTVTIAPAAPACDHVGKTYTYEAVNATTHKVICECGVEVRTENHDYTTDKDGYCKYCPQKCYHDNELVTQAPADPTMNADGTTHTKWNQCSCGEKINQGTWFCADNENATDGDHACDVCGRENASGHIGGEADCVHQAICSDCGEQYGNLGDHTYVFHKAQDAIHAKDELKAGVAAHYDCAVCKKVFTENYEETDLEALTGETPVHGNFQNVPASNNTHNVNCGTCGYTKETVDCSDVNNDGDHACDVCGRENASGHIGGEADCVHQAICSDCGAEYGDIDPANHAGEKSYEDTFEDMSQHLVYCNKCGDYWDSQNPSAPHEANEEGYCECGLFAVVQDFNGGQISTKPPYPEMTEEAWTYMVESELGGFDATSMSRFTHGFSIIVKDENIAMMNLMFVKEGYKLVGLAYDAEGTQRYNGEHIEKPTTLYYVWEPLHTHAHDHYDITETTHQSICSCGEILGEAEEHDYTFDETTHKCVCGKVETFTLTVNVLATGEEVTLTVPYGANILEVLKKAVDMELIPAIGSVFDVDDGEYKGNNIVRGYSYMGVDEEGEDWIYNLEGLTMPASDFAVDQDFDFIGWRYCYDGDNYVGAEYSDGTYWLNPGWYYIKEDFDGVDGGAWYYFYKVGSYCFRAEGLTRVPYPTVVIEGTTYGPDKEAIDYAAGKGQTFIDAKSALFLFGADGKFQFEVSGLYEGHVYSAGMQKWHPGLIEIDGEYYYFIGDVENGGNIAANGDTYITRNNGNIDFVLGEIYFFVNGKLSTKNGVVDGYYYENGQLMIGKGLVRIGDKYIYVRSNGYVVKDDYYYVPANDLGIVSARYYFDAYGYMVDPNTNMYNGIVDGFYYVDGKVQYGAGLVQYENGYIYVRSNGQVVMGRTYWITNTNGKLPAGKYEFGADGKLLPVKDGIVEVEGVLYYYDNNHVQYGAGLVEIEEGVYIYVRSNGRLAIGEYWVTNSNEAETGLKAGKYIFGNDGKLTVN